jgi:hypothetical protein
MSNKIPADMAKPTHIARCQCGAITVYFDNNTDCSMTLKTFLKEFPGFRIPTEAEYHNCNHCVNNWGIDLCGCGSGEPLGKCEGEFEECQYPYTPAQIMGTPKSFVGWRR